MIIYNIFNGIYSKKHWKLSKRELKRNGVCFEGNEVKVTFIVSVGPKDGTILAEHDGRRKNIIYRLLILIPT